MRLGLGTVQFGLAYGVANKNGKVPFAEAFKIVDFARSVGIDVLDTAISYGDSESCLGKIGVNGLRVISKLPPIPDECGDVELWMNLQIQGAMERLGVDTLYGLLLHRPDQIFGIHSAKLIQTLALFKTRGLVRKIGVSIYSPSDLEVIMRKLPIDLVQAPLNLFDRRLVDSGWLSRLARLGVEVHVRSVFLQGLLLLSKSELPHKFNRWSVELGKWYEWLEKNPRVTPLQATLSFALSHSEIDRVIIGVDNLAQIKQIVQGIDVPITSPFPEVASTDEMLINPSNWNLL